MLPQYGTVMKRGVLYYRTRIKDTNGKLVAIYAKTPEELYNKETLALEQINLYCSRQRTIQVYHQSQLYMIGIIVQLVRHNKVIPSYKPERYNIIEVNDYAD